jgi:LysM repeat protein
MLLAVLGLILWGCVPISQATTERPTQTLQPRLERQNTATEPAPAMVSAVETSGPTPTPFSHLIVEGDTLLGIALQYGVELNDLLLANPGANPRFLTVGSSLVVPLGGADGPVPTATPRPVGLSPVSCYPALSGELWCFLNAGLAEGPPIEGLVGLVTLLDAGGQPLRTEPAFSPLNLLLPGSELPLVAYFAPPVPEFSAAVAAIISAVSAGEPAGRYLPVEVVDVVSSISEDRLVGTVEGFLALEIGPDQSADWIRVVIVGLDAGGQIVGFSTFDPGEAGRESRGRPFRIEVASLGPPIARLALLTEARVDGS